MLSRFMIAALTFAVAVPVFAGQAEGDACAAQLGPNAQLIYKDSAPATGKDTDIHALLKEHTTQLVKDGKVPRDQARAAAQAAGGCIKELMK